MLYLAILLFFVGALTIQTRQLSNEEVDQCIEAKRAWNQCKKSFGNMCNDAGYCGSIRPSGKLKVPANLSLTDQALWESSHQQK